MRVSADRIRREKDVTNGTPERIESAGKRTGQMGTDADKIRREKDGTIEEKDGTRGEVRIGTANIAAGSSCVSNQLSSKKEPVGMGAFASRQQL